MTSDDLQPDALDDDARIRRLQGLGLTENQAKVYVALLRLGRTRAAPLGKAAGVPRNKVYMVVDELNERGLVDIILAEPIEVTARPIEDHLRLLAVDLDNRKRRLADETPKLNRMFALPREEASPGDDAGSFRIVRGRRAVTQHHLRLNAEAKRSVQFLGSANTAGRTFNSGSLDAYPDPGQLQRRVFLTDDPEKRETLGRLNERLDHGLRLTDIETGGLIIKIVDDESVFINHAIPDSESATHGDDLGVWTTNKVFIHLAKLVLQLAEDHSVPFDEVERPATVTTQARGA